jgi:hypothetical protein
VTVVGVLDVGVVGVVEGGVVVGVIVVGVVVGVVVVGVVVGVVVVVVGVGAVVTGAGSGTCGAGAGACGAGACGAWGYRMTVGRPATVSVTTGCAAAPTVVGTRASDIDGVALTVGAGEEAFAGSASVVTTRPTAANTAAQAAAAKISAGRWYHRRGGSASA